MDPTTGSGSVMERVYDTLNDEVFVEVEGHLVDISLDGILHDVVEA